MVIYESIFEADVLILLFLIGGSILDRSSFIQSEIGRILHAQLDVEVIESWLKDRVFQPEQVAKLFITALVEILSWTPRLNKSTFSPVFSEIFRLSQADANVLS